ncbi:MAG: hypothetical protein QF511_03600 [Rhodospirillales bacterium]|nr:hypothetical protein [Rhodospirillales bacterium]HIJ46185.1 hypothetical protein [Rhodospirillaceae bacterium]HJP53345.1 hypothetical protein [Rhodospirillales bacterium]
MPGGEVFPDGVDYPNFMGGEYNHIRLRGIALPKTSQGAETNPRGMTQEKQGLSQNRLSP